MILIIYNTQVKAPKKSKQGVKLTKKLVFNFKENETKHCFCYGHTKIMLLAL